MSRRYLVLQYVVFKDVPLNLVVRVTAFAQEKSASESVCSSEANLAEAEEEEEEETKTNQTNASARVHLAKSNATDEQMVGHRHL